MVTNSSAAVGCSATVASKSALVAFILMAIATAWMISAAPSPTMWQPSTRSVEPSTRSFIEDWAERIGFEYPKALAEDLKPYLRPVDEGGEGSGPGELAKEWVRNFAVAPDTRTIDFLVALNRAVNADVGYSVRMEAGVQTPDHTLRTGIGSCRDSAWLLVSILRQLGLAARFVSGYLVQLTSDVEALDGPSGPAADFTDLHAWTEVYIPGAGWIGLDPTSGLFAGEGHIPLSATPHPDSAAPDHRIDGALRDDARVHQRRDPRARGPAGDAALHRGRVGCDRPHWEPASTSGWPTGDVRLTVGGEPTFVSIDNQVEPEWTTDADGQHKRQRASALAARLKRGVGARRARAAQPGQVVSGRTVAALADWPALAAPTASRCGPTTALLADPWPTEVAGDRGGARRRRASCSVRSPTASACRRPRCGPPTRIR